MFILACKSSEMAELPARLIDWFHVLKVNEKVQEMKDQRIEQEPVMKEESFTDEKLKSMCKFAIYIYTRIYLVHSLRIKFRPELYFYFILVHFLVSLFS